MPVVASLEALSRAAGRSTARVTAWVLVLAAVPGVVKILGAAVVDKRHKGSGRTNPGFGKVEHKAGKRLAALSGGGPLSEASARDSDTERATR